jgi:nucleotide-binding universal stress UspA family protein
MFGRIVVGTDGSDTAAHAVKEAVDLAKRTDSRLDIVTAFEPIPAERLRKEGQADVPGDVQYAFNPNEDANVTLDNAAGPARSEGIEVQTHSREGDPADAILDIAEEIDANLIVVGNKGMTGAKRFLLGSVPNKISHHAPCDVMIVRTT